jgi:hypothetical protein
MKDYTKDDNFGEMAASKIRRTRKRTGEAIVEAAFVCVAPSRPGEVIKRLRTKVPLDGVKSDDLPPMP